VVGFPDARRNGNPRNAAPEAAIKPRRFNIFMVDPPALFMPELYHRPFGDVNNHEITPIIG
jgi:hypothetical protein